MDYPPCVEEAHLIRRDTQMVDNIIKMRQSRDKVCFISNKKIKIYNVKPIFIIIKENLPEMLLERLHLVSADMERVNVIAINIHRQ